MKTIHTPIEKYNYKGYEYFVKREDLCCLPPGPSFSKIRGLMEVLSKLKDQGKKYIGYTETSCSMAGWGVAYGCQQLGLQAVIFDPQYKETPSILSYHRLQWKKFNPIVLPIKAGMAKVNYHIATKELYNKFGIRQSIMLPLGLPFKNTITSTHKEAKDLCKEFNTVVVSVGSGTICAGVLLAFKNKHVYGIMCRTGNIQKKKSLILSKAGLFDSGFLSVNFDLIDPKYEYTQRIDIESPFPSHPYYDAKALKWTYDNIETLDPPVLFWNVGSMPKEIS